MSHPLTTPALTLFERTYPPWGRQDSASYPALALLSVLFVVDRDSIEFEVLARASLVVL